MQSWQGGAIRTGPNPSDLSELSALRRACLKFRCFKVGIGVYGNRGTLFCVLSIRKSYYFGVILKPRVRGFGKLGRTKKLNLRKISPLLKSSNVGCPQSGFWNCLGAKPYGLNPELD